MADLFVEIESFRCLTYDEQMKAEQFYREVKDKKKTDEFCKKILSKKYANRLRKEANLSKRFSTRIFANFKIENNVQKNAYEKAFNYYKNIKEMQENGVGIIFVGNGCVGTGKTHLAYSIANALLGEGVPIKVINVTDMVFDLKQNFDVDKYKKVPILLIDDLGKENGTQWICEALYNIFNYRYENMLPVIITTENSLADIANNYKTIVNGQQLDRGKSIISRLTEDFIYIQLTGEDYRQKREAA